MSEAMLTMGSWFNCCNFGRSKSTDKYDLCSKQLSTGACQILV